MAQNRHPMVREHKTLTDKRERKKSQWHHKSNARKKRTVIKSSWEAPANPEKPAQSRGHTEG